MVGCAQPDLTGLTPDTEITNADRMREAAMLGSWYGEYASEQYPRVEFITTRLADNSFTVRFRTHYTGGDIELHRETGIWSVRGDIYYTMTKEVYDGAVAIPADETDPYYYDPYEITEFTDTFFRYRAVKSGFEFTAKRDDEEFDFTSEDVISDSKD